MANPILPEVSCLTAKEFLEALSPTGQYFENEELNAPWLFRGQGKNTEWSLIPSLFRTDSFSKEKLHSFTDRNIDSLPELLQVERDLIVQFFEVADKRGLTIPDDSQQLRIFLESLRSFDDHVRVGGWRGRVKDKALSLMALAQHYGLPTRLLDWTKNSYTAAFFAAESSNSLLRDGKISPTERFIVWSFYFPNLGKQSEDARRYEPLIVVTAPQATNTNLKAQQGVFTLINSFYFGDYDSKKYDQVMVMEFLPDNVPEIEFLNDAITRYKGYPSLDIFWENLDQTVEDIPFVPERDLVTNLVRSVRFQKFTLPASESSSLLRLLSKYDITYSTIYPGYQSIASDLKMRKNWD